MINWKNKQIPILYLFIYKLMKEKSHSNVFISYADVRELLRRRIHNVPRIYHFLILEEMEEIGIIKKIGNKKNFKYEFVGKDVEKLLNKYTEILF